VGAAQEGRSLSRLRALRPLARGLIGPLRDALQERRLPREARDEASRDRAGAAPADPGVDRAVAEGIAWLGRAQDGSTSRDGGVARHFSLVSGWGPSYPETTGYIVPTLIDFAQRTGDAAPRERARRMVDWLVSIQLPDGGFQGGTIGATPLVPVTFNTGQILLGLAAGVRAFGDEYRGSLRRAGDWLVATQDPDGCWRRFPTPFAAPGEKTYETHVAWGLLEAARVDPDRGYADAALSQVRWALSHQRENGWFDRCCLTDPTRPLTHTLGYALRGVVEAALFSDDASLLARAQRTADGLLGALRDDGFIPGRLRSNWSAAARWACLTGSAQIAHCWLLLYRTTGDPRYRDAARAANRYVRRTIRIDGPDGARGGVKGSFPVSGGYGAYEYLNWACKFAIDSNLLERETRAGEEGRSSSRRPPLS
jgi:hypothetical protein